MDLNELQKKVSGLTTWGLLFAVVLVITVILTNSISNTGRSTFTIRAVGSSEILYSGEIGSKETHEVHNHEGYIVSMEAGTLPIYICTIQNGEMTSKIVRPLETFNITTNKTTTTKIKGFFGGKCEEKP